MAPIRLQRLIHRSGLDPGLSGTRAPDPIPVDQFVIYQSHEISGIVTNIAPRAVAARKPKDLRTE